METTTDRRERARLRGLLQYVTSESRRAHGELTRRKMAAPASQKLSPRDWRLRLRKLCSLLMVQP
jgi:hypothetical protein